MRVLLPLLCLCCASALAANIEAVKMDEMILKKEDMLLKHADMQHAPDMQFTNLKKFEMPIAMDWMPVKFENFLLKKDDLVTGINTDINHFGNTFTRVKDIEVDNLLHNILSKEFHVKPEILKAFNLTAEMEHWRKEGNPDALPFRMPEGEENAGDVEYLIMSTNVPLVDTQSVNYADKIRFHFFNKFDINDLKGFEFNDINTLKAHGWDEQLPTKVIIHGWVNKIKSPSVQLIKNAYLKTGKYNVIGVDWGKLAKNRYYPMARSEMVGVGARVGRMLDMLVDAKMLDVSKLHIIGHSLGAHAAGIAAKSMTKGVPSRITGLDPAKPLFELTGRDGRLFHTDAELVDVIHTNAGLLGRTDLSGHVDFFPNGGTWQIGCSSDFTGSCSHGRSYELFARAIESGKGFEGVFCEGLPSLQAGKQCLARAELKALMGEIVSFPKSGPYFVEYEL